MPRPAINVTGLVTATVVGQAKVVRRPVKCENVNWARGTVVDPMLPADMAAAMVPTRLWELIPPPS